MRVEKGSGSGRYDRIVKMIEESEKLKSTTEDKASRLADRLVPYTLGGTALTYLLTRNRHEGAGRSDGGLLLRAEALHAHRRALRHAGVQQLSHLRQGRPLPGGRGQGGYRGVRQDRHPDLRHAPPGPGGALRRATPRTICCGWPPVWRSTIPTPWPTPWWTPPGSGTSATRSGTPRWSTWWPTASPAGWTAARMVIGSAHFVFQDEGCTMPRGAGEVRRLLPDPVSHLVLASPGKLAAVICVDDPLRVGGHAIMRELPRLRRHARWS